MLIKYDLQLIKQTFKHIWIGNINRVADIVKFLKIA